MIYTLLSRITRVSFGMNAIYGFHSFRLSRRMRSCASFLYALRLLCVAIGALEREKMMSVCVFLISCSRLFKPQTQLLKKKKKHSRLTFIRIPPQTKTVGKMEVAACKPTRIRGMQLLLNISPIQHVFILLDSRIAWILFIYSSRPYIYVLWHVLHG